MTKTKDQELVECHQLLKEFTGDFTKSTTLCSVNPLNADYLHPILVCFC